MRHVPRFLTAAAVCGLLLGQSARGAEPTAAAITAERVKFFETQVRPLLAEQCYSCHGEKKQKGGLRLDSAEAVAKGGKNGAVLVAGKPGESKLILAVSYKDEDLQMPPEEQLSAEQVEVLTRWVAMGAPYPASPAAVASAPMPKSKKRTITDEDRGFWSFLPPKAVTPPEVAEAAWSKNPIDRFVFAKLAAEGLTPALAADRGTLVRRAYLDLWGLPPTPQQVEAFVNDPSPGAWENLIDQLLASPRYGERMATHWLDVVRYAESDGYKADSYRPNAWPYRDYVIRSFNEDKPYDRFVREHLAGDEMAPADPNALVGVSFLRHGIYEYNQADVKKQWQTILDEVTDVTADAFLGLSMGCAKCHDHKFDPILQTDYYRLEAFFAGMLPKQDAPLATAGERAAYQAQLKVWEEKTADLRRQIAEIERPYVEKSVKGALAKFPPEIQEIYNKPAGERTPYEEQIAQLAGRQVVEKVDAAKVTGAERDKHLALLRKLAEFDSIKPKPLQTSLLVGEVGKVAPPTFVMGDPAKAKVEAGYPVVLDRQPLAVPEIKGTEAGTGRRTALAEWLTQPNHPLTTRVAVNRVWQWHFGRGIVGTASDFGKIGERPTHPELLDYLAVQFVKDGWSFKQIQRLIMTSATYRQSSTRGMPEVARAKDPENRLLWKFPPRRLEAEQIRDSMLAASGELKLEEGAGGPSSDPSTPRRTVYTKVQRNNRDPLLEVFDVPDTFGSAADRNRTTTSTQSLLMINGDAPLKRAEMFAARLRGMGLKTADETVEAAWELAYGRRPTPKEREVAAAFLAAPRGDGPAVAVNVVEAPERASFAPTSIDQKPLVKSMPQLGSQAIYVRNGRPDDMLTLSSPAGMPTGDFTVEAYVLLDSVYDDASVRVIASQWDGKNEHPGWALGVTSAKSRYEPQNLILQLACDPKKPGGGYEVIASDFKVELHKTYYVAVSVRMGETGEAGVTFYIKDVGDMDAPLKAVGVRHKLTGSYANGSALVIGGRDSTPGHGWDGLIDEVRISRKALGKEELLYGDGLAAKTSLAGHWVFEDQPGIFKDSAGVQSDLVKPAAQRSAAAITKDDAALVDFCHVLLNSNRFLYLD